MKFRDDRDWEQFNKPKDLALSLVLEAAEVTEHFQWKPEEDEAIVQNMVQLQNGFQRYGEVGERLRAIPDFIVVDKSGKPEFVEVKFRFDPDAILHDETIEILERVEKYWNPQVIFINCVEKPYFRICKPPYFKNFSLPKKGLIFEPLISASGWDIDPQVYADSEALVEKYMTPTLKR